MLLGVLNALEGCWFLLELELRFLVCCRPFSIEDDLPFTPMAPVVRGLGRRLEEAWDRRPPEVLVEVFDVITGVGKLDIG